MLRDAGLITLKSFGDNKADLKIIAEQLDQQQTQTLIDYMHQTILDIVGYAEPGTAGVAQATRGSGSKCGMGTAAQNPAPKADELDVQGSGATDFESRAFDYSLHVGTALKLADVEIRFTRRTTRTCNLRRRYLCLLNCDKIAPSLAFAHCGMFSDAEDA